jgi:hypothetical protein
MRASTDSCAEPINDAIDHEPDRQLFGFLVIDDPAKVRRIVEIIEP